MGSLWAPFGCPSWLKFALGTLPEGVRKRIIFKNAVFAPVLRFLLRKPYLGGQDGAQKGPRWDQDGSKTVLAAVFSVFVFDFVFGTILVPFWLPKCLPLGTLFGAKIDPKIDQNLISKEDRHKIIRMRFWLPFWLLLGASWGAFWEVFGSQNLSLIHI